MLGDPADHVGRPRQVAQETAAGPTAMVRRDRPDPAPEPQNTVCDALAPYRLTPLWAFKRRAR
jgi:hypothetical protein